MKCMLDTNMCIYAQKKNENVLAKLKENWEEGLAISSITLAELEYGVKASPLLWQNSFQSWRYCLLTVPPPLNMGIFAPHFAERALRSVRWICLSPLMRNPRN